MLTNIFAQGVATTLLLRDTKTKQRRRNVTRNVNPSNTTKVDDGEENKLKGINYSNPNIKGKIYKDAVRGTTYTSVGTHLVLETLFPDVITKKDRFDPERKIPKVDITEYSYHVWNIYTIVRNLLSAIPYKNKVDIIRDKEFGAVLADEVTAIGDMYFLNDIEPILFFPNYGDLYRGMNVNKTSAFTKVYEEHMLVKDVLKKLKSSKLLNPYSNGDSFRLPRLKGKILITTHLAIDLLNRADLYLLESHTGVLKTKDRFNTKYHQLGDDKMATMPFTEKLLHILGDKTIVKPHKLEIRRDLVSVANRSKWTPRTTPDKIGHDINKLGTSGLREIYHGYRSYY